MVTLEQNLYQNNEGYHLIDALPYIDTDAGKNDPVVTALIEDEMKSLPKKNYLAGLPEPNWAYFERPMIAQEMKRAAAKQPITGGVDMARYSMRDPTTVELQPWADSVNRMKTNLEHANLRAMNLELMDKYNPKLWSHHVAGVLKFDKALEREVELLRNEREAINKKRKLDQISCGNNLRLLLREYEEYLSNNEKVELAIAEKEAEHALLKKQALERGVYPDILREEIGEDENDEAYAAKAADIGITVAELRQREYDERSAREEESRAKLAKMAKRREKDLRHASEVEQANIEKQRLLRQQERMQARENRKAERQVQRRAKLLEIERLEVLREEKERLEAEERARAEAEDAADEAEFGGEIASSDDEDVEMGDAAAAEEGEAMED